MIAAVADVGQVDDEIAGQLALHRHVPALDVAGFQIVGNVIDPAVERVEVGRHVQPRGISRLSRPEAGHRRLVRRAGALRRLLGDGNRHHVRTVERQQVFAAEAIEVDVAQAVGGAQHGLLVQAVGHAHPRRDVVAIRLHQRAIRDRPVVRLQERPRRRVEVGEEVVRLPLRRRELVAKPEIQRQRRQRPPVVLQIREVHPLTEVEDERVDQLVGAARAHEKVGEIEGRGIGGGAGRAG